jgi:hypothetical protein
VIKVKMRINEMKNELNSKNRELESLKLVKKELSEREFQEKINYVEERSKHYRELASKLMKKYKGKNEDQGIDNEKIHQYKYNNEVLREYDELSRELNHKLETISFQKAKKEVRALTNIEGA